MDKENVLIGHIMVDLDLYLITKDLSIEEKANYYDAIMKKYRHEDYRKHLITSAVEMCFKFSCLAIDKCKILGKQKQEQRSESARTAANARWNGAKKGKAKENEIFDAEEVEQFPWKAFYEPFPKHEDRKK